MKTAYPRFSNVVSIRLYSNIPFDNTYKNHSLISDRFKYNNTKLYQNNNRIACEEFIDRKTWEVPSDYVYPRYDIFGDFNFDFKNGLIGSITLELLPEQTNANYLRIKVGSSTANIYDYYYYFITSINQVNAGESVGTYTLTLECDVLMTYQDEFLDGMKDMPVFTARKHSHRYTNNGLLPHGVDLRSSDDAFSGIKPSYLDRVQQTHLNTDNMKKMEKFDWLYICFDPDITFLENTYNECYSFKSITHPLAMLCVPIGKGNRTLEIHMTVPGGGDTIIYTANENFRKQVVAELVGNGKVHSCKITPYPPFSLEDATVSEDSVNNKTTILIPNMTPDNYAYTWTSAKSVVRFIMQPPYTKYIFVIKENNTEYSLGDVSLMLANTTAPTITSARYKDPRLLFSPFKKYCISAPYGSSEFYPELFTINVPNIADDNISLKTISSCYIGDNTFFTYITGYNFEKENIGLSSNVNYNVPAGTNALDLFNSTQANSFYTSKVASGITSGLSIAGGIASIVVGAGMTVGSSGTLSPMGAGLIASGSMAIAGGTAGISTTIASANAKVEDLKNTPDSFNVAGSSYTSDIGRASITTTYIVWYKCPDDITVRANDFFYNYGYQVARECYFNTEIKYDADNNVVDENLFGRTLFNYIQLNEDITNKINANIPLVVKQKLSKIFNDGITLWSFFASGILWDMAKTAEQGLLPSSDPLTKWFLRCTYDNTEYAGEFV